MERAVGPPGLDVGFDSWAVGQGLVWDGRWIAQEAKYHPFIPTSEGLFYSKRVERIVHKARSFREADAWDISQHRAMTPNERMRAAREIRERVFPGPNPDIREWHRRKRDE
jgi:hypothetical protein